MAEQTEKAWIANSSGTVSDEQAVYPPEHLRDFRRFLDWGKTSALRVSVERADAASADDCFHRRVNAARFRF